MAPGRAEVCIPDWDASVDGVELCLQRNDGAPYLDVANRQWVGEQQWIRLQGATLQDGALVMRVGPDFVDTLLAGTQGPRCRAFVRVMGGEEVKCAFRVASEVMPSAAAGTAPSLGAVTQIDAEAPPVVQDDPPSGIPPDAPETAGGIEPPAPIAPPRRKTGLLLAGLALLLVAAAVAAYLLRGKPPASEPAVPSEAKEASAAPPTGCSVAALPGPGGNAMAFVQDCVRDVKDSAALLTVIRAARDKGQCDIAQRLYANRANAGDIDIALAYAQEYDPAYAKPNECFKPEAATARYWYESVLEKDPKQAEAAAKLKALPH
ncbi:hypothetical protein [Achromobacter aloeverae]